MQEVFKDNPTHFIKRVFNPIFWDFGGQGVTKTDEGAQSGNFCIKNVNVTNFGETYLLNYALGGTRQVASIYFQVLSYQMSSQGVTDLGAIGVFLNASQNFSDITPQQGYLVSVHFIPPTNISLMLGKLVDGSYTGLNSVSFALQTNTWYKLEGVYQSGVLVGRIYDLQDTKLLEIVGSDTSYSSGYPGWAFYCAGGVSISAKFDFWVAKAYA